ncbi:MAG: Fmu (Sun) domain-containing protein [Bacteroidota bacterium]
MSRSHNQLITAQHLLERYRSGEPFHLYLKQYFSANRKHGSSDRRILRDLCYAYFRIGQLWTELDMEERILSAYYLIHPEPAVFLQALRPQWPVPTSEDPFERAKSIGKEIQVTAIFSKSMTLSSGIELTAFSMSHLRQPDLFIRIRPGCKTNVIHQLDKDTIPYRLIGDYSIALGNATLLESRFLLDQEVVVQDLSSQRIAGMFDLLPNRPSWRVWDACAASGGKSMLLFDHVRQIELTCTDIRPAILNNLSKRLGRAGVPVIRLQADDLTRQRDRSDFGTFGLIIADVPCTGSGTWARTPEQLYYFDGSSVHDYVNRQRKILSHLVSHMEPNGYLLYLTCSVFSAENEEQVAWLSNEYQLQVVQSTLFAGYSERADTMFATLLRRSTN